MDIDELFLSSDPSTIYKFFDSFQSAEELVNWMRSRPKADINIKVERGKYEDIIVVIPTADINGHYAKGIRKVYEGLTLVFVESRGKYFNFAHSVNEGVKEASSLSPLWVIISNDDMIGVDSSEKLVNELKRVQGFEVIFTPESAYHSLPVYICKMRRGIHMLITIYTKLLYGSLVSMKYNFVLKGRYRIEYDIIGKIIKDTNKKFSPMKYLDVLVPFLCKKKVKIINGGAFRSLAQILYQNYILAY